jgi:hypothetical protein
MQLPASGQNGLLISLVAVTLGCEGQSPPADSPPGSELSTQSVSQAAAADSNQGKAKVEMVFNASPSIDAMLSSSGRLTSNASVALQVKATDPDHDPLSFAWTCTCPGDFERTDLDHVTFCAGKLEAFADCMFQVLVTDGRGGSMTGKMILTTAVPVINVAPAMGIAYQTTDLAAPGEVVLLHASAIDPEGQPISWTWMASNGTLSDQKDQAETSDIRWVAPALPGTKFTITATATDPSGASTSFVFKVQVQPGA